MDRVCMNILIRAIKARLKNNEMLHYVLSTYTKLTESQRDEIKEEIEEVQ